VTSTSTKPEVVWSRRGRHLEIIHDVITALWVVQIEQNLVVWCRIARRLLRYGRSLNWK